MWRAPSTASSAGWPTRTTVPDQVLDGRPATGCADEARHVDVVAAGVHHADVAPGLVTGLHRAGVGKPGLLDNGQGVHVGADQNDGSVAVFEHAHNPELADVRS